MEFAGVSSHDPLMGGAPGGPRQCCRTPTANGCHPLPIAASSGDGLTSQGLAFTAHGTDHALSRHFWRALMTEDGLFRYEASSATTVAGPTPTLYSTQFLWNRSWRRVGFSY